MSETYGWKSRQIKTLALSQTTPVCSVPVGTQRPEDVPLWSYFV